MVAAVGRVQVESGKSEHERIELLMEAIQAGDVSTVERVLDADVDVNASTPHGTTPLMSAAEYGRLEIARSLLKRGAAIDAARSDGFTALALAVFFGRDDIVRELLACGADVNAQSRSGTSLEMWAIARGFVELADFLKSAGQQEAGDSIPMTPPLEPVPAAVVKQREVVEKVEEELAEPTLITPRANLVTYNSEFRSSPVVEAPKQPRVIELDELAAEIKAERAVDSVVPFSVLVTLRDRLGRGWPLVTAVLAVVAILSTVVTITAIKAVKQTPTASQSNSSVAESPKAKPVEGTVSPAQPPASEQAPGSVSSASNEKLPEETSNQSSNHVSSSSPDAALSSEPATANNSEVKQPVSRIIPSYVSDQKKVARAKRRQDEVTIATDNHNAIPDLKPPVPVATAPKAPTTEVRNTKPTDDAPSTPTEPIKGSTPKRKVIQWP